MAITKPSRKYVLRADGEDQRRFHNGVERATRTKRAVALDAENDDGYSSPKPAASQTAPLQARANALVPRKMKVMVVDDHPIVREGICALLQKESDIEIVGRAGSGEEALEALAWAEPDVVLMDIGLPGISGVEATRKAKEISPAIRVLALTMYPSDEYLIEMLDAGASGYLLKQSMVNQLVQAVRSVSSGQSFLDPSATRKVIETLHGRGAAAHPVDGLTEREKSVLKLIGAGCTSKEIASRLFLSPKTVENYRARIMSKLQARNCSEAVSKAIRLGVISPFPPGDH